MTDGTEIDVVIEQEPPKQDAPKTEEPKPNSQIANQAGYYSRHPEELDKLIQQTEVLKSRKAPQDMDMANELRQLRNENALKDALIEHGLSREDIQWINGGSPEEIQSKALKFVEYKKGLVILKSGETPESESPPDQKYIRQNTAPAGSKKPQTFAELEQELLSTKIQL